MQYSVYVRKRNAQGEPVQHYKEDTSWFVGKRSDAVRLARWLDYLGLDAQVIDQDVFAAMPDVLDD